MSTSLLEIGGVTGAATMPLINSPKCDEEVKTGAIGEQDRIAFTDTFTGELLGQTTGCAVKFFVGVGEGLVCVFIDPNECGCLWTFTQSLVVALNEPTRLCCCTHTRQ